MTSAEGMGVSDARPGPSVRARVRVIEDTDDGRRDVIRRDDVATEEPLEIRLAAGAARATVAVTMRTPGHDFELVAGYLLAEGVIAAAEDLVRVDYCTDLDVTAEQQFNVVTAALRADALPELATLDRHGYTSSACGVCGKANIDALAVRCPPVTVAASVTAEALFALPDRLRAAQGVFARTGGLHAAGLDSFAGAGAEILTERARSAIAPLKEPGHVWLSVMETAHELGVESTVTFMMGTGETNAERIEHLRMIRDVQDRTGGFRSFIPWTYQPENNHLKGRTQATSLEYLRMIAVARLFFDNVNHLQGSWLTTGKDIGQLTLHFGADDLGSVMLEENVVSSAGARHRSNRTELIELIRGAGRIPAQRDTLYRHIAVHDDPAKDPVDDRVHSHFASTALKLLPVATAGAGAATVEL